MIAFCASGRHHWLALPHVTVWVACISSLLLPPDVFAQPTQHRATLSGRVIEAGSDDFGIADAQISVVGTQISARTDATGRFTLSRLPAGPVTIVAQAEDYAAAHRRVLPARRHAPVTIALRYQGERSTVRVVAARSDDSPQTASETRVTRRDITAAPHRNAEEVLEQVPGVMLVQHGSEGKGHQFFLRGFDAMHGADIEVTVQGIPLNEWSNIHAQGYLDLGLIIPEMIQGVRVTKGPFTLDQGAFAMAGSARYRLGVPRDLQGWRTAYTIGTTRRHRLFAGYAPPEGEGRQFVGVAATHDDGFGTNRALNRAALNAQKRLYAFEHGGELYAMGLGHHASFCLPGPLRNEDINTGFVGFYGAYDPLAHGESSRGLLALRYVWSEEPRAADVTVYGGYRPLELLENFTGFLVHPEDGDRREQAQTTWSFGFLSTYTSRLSRRLALRMGLGLRGDAFSQREYHVGRALERLSTRRDLRGVQTLTHGYAGLRWTPHHTVHVDAGGRAALVALHVTDPSGHGARNEGRSATIAPRVTAMWHPRSTWRHFIAYGQGYRPPEARAFSEFSPEEVGLGEEIYTGGHPRVTTSDAFEVGTRWDPALWWGLRLAAFATFIERESVFDHVSGVNLELNGTRRLGAEIGLVSDPLPWLSVSADLTAVQARFIESGNNVPFAPELVLGARGIATHPSGVRVGARVRTIAPRPLPHGATGATLVMTDAVLGYRWRWLRLGLELENLFDQRLREGEYHYASRWRPNQPASALPALHTIAGPPFNARLTIGVHL